MQPKKKWPLLRCNLFYPSHCSHSHPLQSLGYFKGSDIFKVTSYSSFFFCPEKKHRKKHIYSHVIKCRMTFHP